MANADTSIWEAAAAQVQNRRFAWGFAGGFLGTIVGCIGLGFALAIGTHLAVAAAALVTAAAVLAFVVNGKLLHETNERYAAGRIQDDSVVRKVFDRMKAQPQPVGAN